MDKIIHELRARAASKNMTAHEAMSVAIALQTAIDHLPDSDAKESARMAAVDLGFNLLLIARAQRTEAA